MRSRLIRALVLSSAIASVLALPQAASAHEPRSVGRYETTVGWLEEPAFAGFRNAVSVAVTRYGAGDDHDGTPVENARLKVEVIFGDKDGTQRMGPVDLRPAFGRPGEYRAFLIPTRPGTYTFHLTGTIGRTKIDEFYTSSERTFNDIQESSTVEFPAKDPSRGDLAQRLERVDPRIESVRVAATSKADSARTLGLVLGLVAIVLASAALVIALRNRATTG